MKKSIILSTIICFTLINSFSLTAFAATKEKVSDTSIPAKVSEKIQQKVKSSEYKLPQIKAYEIDLNGNKTEVTPKSSTATTNNLMSPMSVPTDGFIYTFDHYSSSSTAKNWNFQNAGTFRVANYSSSSNMTATYTQQNTTTTSWSVTANVSGETTVGNGFLAGVKVSAGVEVDRTKTWYSGTTYGVSYSIAPRTVSYLTNYQVGVNSGGTLYWRKYSPSGTSWMGYYTESAGGTVIDKNDVNIELTDTAPM